jgi:uncharacterized membrane protein YcaP (DUF421 family)
MIDDATKRLAPLQSREIDWTAMRRSHISRDDLLASLRAESQLEDVDDVRIARLERSGQISAIEKTRPPRAVTIEVAAGVQTVRLVLDG